MWYRELKAEPLLEDFPESVYTPDGIASLFAIAGDSKHFDRVRSLIQERIGLPSPEEITTWFNTDTTDDDDDWWARLAYLHEIEHAARAAAVLQKHEVSFRRWRNLRRRLQAFVDSGLRRVSEWSDAWTFARVAEEAVALGQGHLAPWSIIEPRGESLIIGDVTSDIVDLWFQEVLHETDETRMIPLLSRSKRLCRQYFEALDWPAAVGIARSENAVWRAMLGVAPQVLWTGPLPHLGPGGFAELLQHRDAITLILASDQGDRTTVRCAADDPSLTYTDPLLGELTIDLAYHDVPDSWVMRTAADEILAETRGSKAVDSVLLNTMLDDFVKVFGPVLAQPPADGDEDAHAALVREAVAVRAAIECACAMASQLDPNGERFRIDAMVADGAALVDRLTDEDYAAAVAGAPTHRESWWTQRAIFDRVLPENDFDTLLDALRPRQHRTYAPPPSFVASAASPPAVDRPIAPQLPDDPSTFYWEPGQVILLVRRENGEGLVFGLKVSSVPSHDDLFDVTPNFAALAKEAVRIAYRAVTRLTRDQVPKRWLSGHRIDLIGLDDTPADLIDGDALALPCALAFASLWLERPLRRWVVATGQLSEDDDVIHVGLAEVSTKLRTLCNRYPMIRDWIAILPEDQNGAPGPPPSVRLEPVGGVKELSDALTVAGLEELSTTRFGPQFDQEANCRNELHQLRAEAEHGTPAVDAPQDRWWDLGDRLRVIAQKLERIAGANDELVVWARIRAAYALLRAESDTKEIEALLKPLEARRLPWYLEAEKRMAALSRLLTDRKEESAEARSAVQAQQEVLRVHAEDLRYEPGLHGRIEGSIGAYYLHLGDPERAIRHNQRALEIFWATEQARHRIAQAVIGLSEGLRLRGLRLDEPHAKRADLDEAQRNLTKVVGLELGRIRSLSRPSYERTLMCRDYTLGRVHLDLGEPKRALQALRAAEERARHAGPWPLVGVLRTKVWAHQALAQLDDADAVLARLDALGDLKPSTLERIRLEAHGPYRTDGEVL